MSERSGPVRTIDARAAAARLVADEPPPILVDVRETIEFAGIRVPEAVLMPLSGLGPRLDELPRDRPLLVICHMGERSAMVTGYLLQNGWEDVANVEGGMVAWERAGLPVRRGAPTEEELSRRPSDPR
jgi:rhodanese-related sulfurtransferase